jgi:hypothetical protein
MAGSVTGRPLSSKRKMMPVDCSDARYELKIGDRVRRSLIRHFHVFIAKQVKSRGIDADDPRVFNQDMIEAEAWRLAATVIEEAEREFRDDEFGAQIGMLVPSSASEYLQLHLPNRVAEAEDDYLTDSHGALSRFIGLASGHFPGPL